jgi:carbon-monoxide dehydrogenase medium subunit
LKPASFNVHRPTRLNDVVQLLKHLQDRDVRLLAGGQSLVPMMSFRLARPSDLIDINGVEELKHIHEENDFIEIGALVRHADLMAMQTSHSLGKILRDIGHHIAHHPIRTRGTFCGSLAHADPSSEWCLAAVTLDALILTHSTNGVRMITAHDFFKGTMTTDVQSDEIITAVRLPKQNANRYCFKEFSRRKGDFCLASVLVVADVSDKQHIKNIAIGVGGVEECPRRMRGAEDLLRKNLSPTSIKHASDMIAAELTPMQDQTTPAAYRRDLAHKLAAHVLTEALL